MRRGNKAPQNARAVFSRMKNIIHYTKNPVSK